MEDQKYMKRALDLAQLGLGKVSPNPAVGAVIVYKDTIIGEGYHIEYGRAHAEVNAINSVKNKDLLPHSTMYVTLEPCSHWGKTPPCADLIVEHKIKKVVIGTLDPYCEVSGRGVEKLKNAGIDVVVGVLKEECVQLNAPFFTYNTLKRPYVILKWAQSKDGFIDSFRKKDTQPVWFTGNDCKVLVHRWRSQIDCIMVGRRTVEMDDPELNVRAFFGRNPIRATIDKDLKLNTCYKIFNDQSKTFLYTKKENEEIARSKFDNNKNVVVVALDFKQDVEGQIVSHLYCNGINSLIIEGGTNLIDSFVKKGLWDEARIFSSEKTLAQIYDNELINIGLVAPIANGKQKITEKYQNCKLSFIFNRINY